MFSFRDTSHEQEILSQPKIFCFFFHGFTFETRRRSSTYVDSPSTQNSKIVCFFNVFPFVFSITHDFSSLLLPRHAHFFFFFALVDSRLIVTGSKQYINTGVVPQAGTVSDKKKSLVATSPQHVFRRRCFCRRGELAPSLAPLMALLVSVRRARSERRL